MMLTQVFDIIPINPRFLVHTPPNPAILLVVVTFVVAIIHANAMVTFLPAQFPLDNSLMKLFIVTIILFCMLPEH